MVVVESQDRLPATRRMSGPELRSEIRSSSSSLEIGREEFDTVCVYACVRNAARLDYALEKNYSSVNAINEKDIYDWCRVENIFTYFRRSLRAAVDTRSYAPLKGA